MPVVIVFQYADDDIADAQALANVLGVLREAVTPKPDSMHVGVRETALAVTAIFTPEDPDA